MAEITTLPTGLPGTPNDLDSLPDDILGGPPPPAYLSFGMTPCPIENPPNADDDDIRVFMVRARCTGEHGPLKRTDGEVRYKRDMQIQAIWNPGDPEPEPVKTKAELDAEAEAEAAKNQPPLYDETTGDPVDGEQWGDESPSGVENPGFSDGGE